MNSDRSGDRLSRSAPPEHTGPRVLTPVSHQRARATAGCRQSSRLGVLTQAAGWGRVNPHVALCPARGCPGLTAQPSRPWSEQLWDATPRMCLAQRGRHGAAHAPETLSYAGRALRVLSHLCLKGSPLKSPREVAVGRPVRPEAAQGVERRGSVCTGTIDVEAGGRGAGSSRVEVGDAVSVHASELRLQTVNAERCAPYTRRTQRTQLCAHWLPARSPALEMESSSETHSSPAASSEGDTASPAGHRRGRRRQRRHGATPRKAL